MSKNRLCARCQEILSEGPVKQERDHFSNGEAFLQAAEQGCYICSWTLNNYKWHPVRNSRVGNPIHYTTYAWALPLLILPTMSETWHLTIKVCSKVSHNRQPSSFTFIRPNDRCELSCTCTARVLKSAVQFPTLCRLNLDPSIRSSETFSLARKYIAECYSEHTECQLPEDYQKLPTRLVFVRESGGGSVLKQIYVAVIHYPQEHLT